MRKSPKTRSTSRGTKTAGSALSHPRQSRNLALLLVKLPQRLQLRHRRTFSICPQQILLQQRRYKRHGRHRRILQHRFSVRNHLFPRLSRRSRLRKHLRTAASRRRAYKLMTPPLSFACKGSIPPLSSIWLPRRLRMIGVAS